MQTSLRTTPPRMTVRVDLLMRKLQPFCCGLCINVVWTHGNALARGLMVLELLPYSPVVPLVPFITTVQCTDNLSPAAAVKTPGIRHAQDIIK